MRNLTIASLALAAAVTLSGLAHADEYVTNENKEAAAIAAQSSSAAAGHLSGTATSSALGYSETAQSRNPLAHVAAPAALSESDALQIQNGNRGIDVN